jgi:glycosyltransferase involved in cell wall biosynthesis
MSKILLITDAWKPQINGVVTTLTNLVEQAKLNGDKIHVFHPGRCKIRFPLPGYSEIQVGIVMPWTVRGLLKKHSWDHIHIATPEGALGIAFARICRKMNIPFSTSCHTKFPEFVNSRCPFVPVELGWRWMRHVYRDSTNILTTTNTMVEELKAWGFTQDIRSWTRGVDTKTFKPDSDKVTNIDQPLLVCVSRVSHEKGLDDFCNIDYPNAKLVIVGDGPYRKELERKYPYVHFTGVLKGEALAEWYRKADCFVFPSKADTFGVVMIESMACGTPVAAYPVTGPVDVIDSGVNGYMSDDLKVAVSQCLLLNRTTVYDSSKKYTWEECYRQFKEILLIWD